ncbi:pentapeptide repeat-containing protein [Sorangium cellulosum]|uniref:pentapeptide repeat-containing protein n=1 Tax=Sorangium TaxID=39643 RepID=UPI0013EBEEA4
MPPLPSFWTSRYSSKRLGGLKLDGAKLGGLKLDGAKLDGAKLDGAKLDGAKLDGGASAARGSVSAPPGRRAACERVEAVFSFTRARLAQRWPDEYTRCGGRDPASTPPGTSEATAQGATSGVRGVTRGRRSA